MRRGTVRSEGRISGRIATLEAALQEAKGTNQLTMLEVACAVGARADLGRPTTTPIQNRDALMAFLREEKA